MRAPKNSNAIHLNIKDDLFVTLKELSAATGTRVGPFILELLRQSEPQLKQLTQIALLAKSAPSVAAVQALGGMMEETMKEAKSVEKDIRQLSILAE